MQFPAQASLSTFQTPALATFDMKVDADSCFPELLLAVATVDVACRCCTEVEMGRRLAPVDSPSNSPPIPPFHRPQPLPKLWGIHRNYIDVN
jgi:hypothetical protein